MRFFEQLLLEKLNEKAKALKVSDIEALSSVEIGDEELSEEDFIDTLIEAKSGESLEELGKNIVNIGGRNLKKYPDFSTIAAEIPFNKVLGLKNQPKVKGVYDGVGKIKYYLDESVSMIFTHDIIKLPDKMPDTGNPPDGSGIKICIIDTGIDSTHPDLSENIIEIKDFTDDADGVDYVGHGTHVASTICGSGKASGGTYRGVAPGAKLLIAKVFDHEENSSRRMILDALLWALEMGADAVNLSLGDSSTAKDGTCPMCKAVDYLSDNGVFVAAAAGNEAQSPDGVEFGSGTISCPGNAKGAFTVGAVTKLREIASFSSRGPTADGREKPDAVAPGVDITAAKPGGSYQKLSGTSMATPHVAGAAAVLKQLYSTYSEQNGMPDTLRPDEIKTALKAGATDLGQDGNSQGAGLINIPAAFNWLEWNKLGIRVSNTKGKRKSHKFIEIVTALFIVVAFATFSYVNPSPFKFEQYIIDKSHSFISRLKGGQKEALSPSSGIQKAAEKTAPIESNSEPSTSPQSTSKRSVSPRFSSKQNQLSQGSNISPKSRLDMSTERKMAVNKMAKAARPEESALPFDDNSSFIATEKEIRRLLEYVDTHPDSLEPFSDLIVLLVENGESDDAATLMQDMIDRNPDNEGMLYNLSLIYIQNNRYKDAIPVLRTIVSKNPDNSSAAYLLSLAEKKQNESVKESTSSEITQTTELESAAKTEPNVMENNPPNPKADSIKNIETSNKNNATGTIDIAKIRERFGKFWKEHIKEVGKTSGASKIPHKLSRWAKLTPYEKVTNALMFSLYLTLLFYLIAHIPTKRKKQTGKTLGTKSYKEKHVSLKGIARHSFHISVSLNLIYFILAAMTIFVTSLKFDNYIGPYIRNPKDFLDLIRYDKIFVTIFIIFVIAKLARIRKSPSF